MNIHSVRVPKGYKPNNTAKPALTRPGKNHPGGRHLRRAFAKLGVRKDNHVYTQGDRKGQSLGILPGSMKGRS